MWTVLQIGFIALGLLLVFGGDRLALPVLVHAGIACLGLAMITTGWEAMITRRLILRRRGRAREAYVGVPAVLQGVQFNLIGLFFIGMAFLSYVSNWQAFFLQMVRRPGLPLLVLGALCLLQSTIMFLGSGFTRENSRTIALVTLILGRLFPGFIWLVLGLALMFAGMVDTVAPARFDEMGGKFLEEMYGLK